MKYLCLVYSIEDSQQDPLSEDEQHRLNEEALAYDDELRRGGHFVHAEALQSIHTATTLRVRNGKVSITDGPFAETKEQLSGFILLEASDLNEALQLASRIPPLRFGAIEVRPVRDLGLEVQTYRQ
jgi:hypothetical protein